MNSQHILLIDDDPDEFDFFLMALQSMPSVCKCTYAGDAAHACDLLHGLVPDIIFVDMNMPAINGMEFLVWMKKQALAFKQIPVYLYSSYMDKSMIERATALGAAGCIQKPVLIKGMAETLKTILQKSECLPFH